MTDSLEVMVGRIDERTETMQRDITQIKRVQQDNTARVDKLRSDVDILKTEHNDHLKQCSPVTVSVNPPPLKLSQMLSIREIALIATGAVFGVGVVAVGVVYVAGKIASLW